MALLIEGRKRDLGGFFVRRLLPHPHQRLIGPFIFFDEMGPAEFAPGKGMDVRPHPHINLATVTYLFEGSIFHRDSLGSAQAIEPGAINWMTAGRGIVHSERTPPSLRKSGGRLHGIQCWVALPTEKEEVEPSFTHHPASSLPEFQEGHARVRLLLGTAFGHASPEPTHADIIYLDVNLPAGKSIVVPAQGRELAAYPVTGALRVSGHDVSPGTLAMASSKEDLKIEAKENARFLVLGGRPLAGERIIWWNFVSSSRERILRGMDDWKNGRFPKVPGDEEEFIPLPDDPLP